MVAPEASSPGALGHPEPPHKSFAGTFTPCALFGAHPDLGGPSGRSASGVPAQPIRRDAIGDKSFAGSIHVLSPQCRKTGEILEAEILPGIKPDPVKQFAVITRLAIRPAH